MTMQRVDGRERLPTPASQVRSPGTPVAPSRDAPISELRVGAPGMLQFYALSFGERYKPFAVVFAN
jgi:hypothetical protein